MQRSAGEARTDILLWTPTHGHTSVGRSAKMYLYQLCVKNGGARGVMVIIVGNRHGDTSSNPGRD